MKRFPYFCRPFDDEIFTSWFFRVAKGNLTNTNTFSRIILNDRSLFNTDCDLRLSDRVLHTLGEELGVNKNLIHSSTISSLIGNYLTDIKDNGHDREVLSARTRYERRNNYGQQYCPICLEKDVAYYKKIWRLTAITICLEHKVVLSDRCPYCNATINCHKLTWFHSGASFCYKCGKTLTKSPIQNVEDFPSIIEFQRKIEESISTGWVDVSPTTRVMTPVFLEGLRFLMKPWCVSKKCSSMYEHFFRYAGIPMTAYSEIKHWPKRLNAQSSLDRFKLYTILGWLLEDWPERLEGFCNYEGLTPTSFFKTNAEPPFWLTDVFQSSLAKKSYWVNMEEIRSATRYLYKNNFKISPANVAEAVGLNRSIYLPASRKRYILRIAKLQSTSNALPVKVFHWK